MYARFQSCITCQCCSHRGKWYGLQLRSVSLVILGYVELQKIYLLFRNPNKLGQTEISKKLGLLRQKQGACVCYRTILAVYTQVVAAYQTLKTCSKDNVAIVLSQFDLEGIRDTLQTGQETAHSLIDITISITKVGRLGSTYLALNFIRNRSSTPNRPICCPRHSVELVFSMRQKSRKPKMHTIRLPWQSSKIRCP